MWFKLASATFSNNLGTMSDLSNSWPVSYSLSGGIDKNSCPSFVTKNNNGTQAEANLTATFTLKATATVISIVAKVGNTVVASVGEGGSPSITVDKTKITGPVTIEASATSVSTGGGEPSTPVNPPSGGATTLTLYKSATGNSILDYQDVWKMFGASSLATLGSQIIGVDISAYAGQTITITAAQSVISGANYAMFCSNLPNAYIKSLAELDGYNSFGTATSYIAESYDNLIESFNISTVKETTNTVSKVVPANAKYLFFANLSTKCANPSVVVGNTAGASLVSYTTENGWCCMDYQTYFYLTANSTFKGYQSKVIAVDVSELVGKTLSITATQSVVDGAYYAFFTNKLPTGINSIEQIEGLTYSDSGKYNFANKASDLVGESFNVSTEHQVVNTITKVVPTGAKYLFVNTLNKFGSSEIKLA